MHCLFCSSVTFKACFPSSEFKRYRLGLSRLGFESSLSPGNSLGCVELVKPLLNDLVGLKNPIGTVISWSHNNKHKHKVTFMLPILSSLEPCRVDQPEAAGLSPDHPTSIMSVCSCSSSLLCLWLWIPFDPVPRDSSPMQDAQGSFTIYKSEQ